MDRALPWALGSGASSWRGRACSCPGLGVGGGSLPHCRCTFDVARAVGQRKPELPSVAPLHQCHPVFNEAAEDVGLWARGGAGRKSRRSISAGDEREFVPRLLPTHPHSILSPLGGVLSVGSRPRLLLSFPFPHFTEEKNTHWGVCKERAWGLREGSSLSPQVSTSFPCGMREGATHTSGRNRETKFLPSALARQPHPTPVFRDLPPPFTILTVSEMSERETETQRDKI